MAWRYFPGKDATWLLAELDKCMKDQSLGSTLVSGSAGDVSWSRLNQVDIDERMRRLKFDLCVLDPVTYPPGDYLDVTTTKAVFS